MSEFDEWWNESRFLVGDAHRAFARRAWDAALAKREADEPLAAFTAWLSREMPEGTVISDPAWWAPKILRAVDRSRIDELNAKREAVPVVKEDLTTVQAVAVPDLWSFLRNVLRQGAAIESQQGQQGYETFIAHIEDAASRQEKKLRAMLAASQQAAKGEGT